MQTVWSFLKAPHVSLACLFLLVWLEGCRDSTSALDSPDSLVVYSIDGVDPEREVSKYLAAVERFHGYPVLGKVEIEDEKKRNEILAAVKEGIRSSDGIMAKCFWPRHGLRVTHGEKITDFVICFQCYQLEIHERDKMERDTTTEEPQEVLNATLQESEIPLAPE